MKENNPKANVIRSGSRMYRRMYRSLVSNRFDSPVANRFTMNNSIRTGLNRIGERNENTCLPRLPRACRDIPGESCEKQGGT